jgi:hypothetical protein
MRIKLVQGEKFKGCFDSNDEKQNRHQNEALRHDVEINKTTIKINPLEQVTPQLDVSAEIEASEKEYNKTNEDKCSNDTNTNALSLNEVAVNSELSMNEKQDSDDSDFGGADLYDASEWRDQLPITTMPSSPLLGNVTGNIVDIPLTRILLLIHLLENTKNQVQQNM